MRGYPDEIFEGGADRVEHASLILVRQEALSPFLHVIRSLMDPPLATTILLLYLTFPVMREIAILDLNPIVPRHIKIK